MSSKLAVYNNALLHIGSRKLASLTEAAERRRVLDDAYSQEVRSCLQSGQWNFATRAIEVQSSTSVVPTFGYQFAFTKPDDWVRTIGLSADESLETPLNEYRDEAGYWFASVDPLYVRFVSSHVSYGLDLSKWPDAFASYVELRLATKTCKRITGSEPSDNLLRSYKDAKKSALSLDAMDDPAPSLPTGSWVRARAGGRRSAVRERMNLS